MGRLYKFSLPHTILLFAFVFLFLGPIPVFSAFGDCSSGYEFQRMSGVGCVQKNCYDVPNAHLSYEGYCICGSAGSIAENPNDPNKRCTKPHEDPSCPDCVYACVHNNEECPGDPSIVKPTPLPTTTPQPKNEEKMNREQERIFNQLNQFPLNDSPVKVMTAGISWQGVKNIFRRGFGATMEVVNFGLTKVSDYQLIQDKDDTTAGWSGTLVAPDGDWADVKFYEGSLDFDWENKRFAAEFNLVSVKDRPGRKSFIDGFSIGVGPGAVNPHDGNYSVPGTPVSPNVNFDNIKEYFGEKWDGTKSWWNENIPWPLGSAGRPNVGGGE